MCGVLPGTKEKQKDRASPPQWCSVKEPVEIDFVLHNPLDVEMHLKHILLSAHIDRDGGGGEGRGGEKRSRGSSVDQASVELPTISQLTLPPKSNTTLRMRVVPLREGVLTIEGIQWRLCPTSETPETPETSETVENNRNTILCLHDFDLLGEKLHDTRDHRAMGARAKDTRLQVTVVGPRPWVGLKLATQAEEEGGREEGNIVANVVAGQLIQLSLTLTNLGDAPAHCKLCWVLGVGCWVLGAVTLRLPVSVALDGGGEYSQLTTCVLLFVSFVCSRRCNIVFVQ